MTRVEQSEYRGCAICGLRVKIPENFKAPRGRCPRCGELISNPNWRYLKEDRKTQKLWSVGNLKKLKSWLIAKLEPKFDELTVFYIGAAFVLTFLVHIPEIINWYNSIGLFLAVAFVAYIISASLLGIPFISGLVFFFSGLIFSLYHVFNKKIKKPNDKKLMGFFAVSTNLFTGIAGAYYIAIEALELKELWLWVFPVWTLVNSFFLVLKCKAIEKNEEAIAEEKAFLGEISFGLTVLLIGFGICHFGFALYWPFTLSICVVYATSFSKAFGSIFLNKGTFEQPAGVNDKCM
jgi:DNA-directed RNA polymerase subunit RPC12/RpoP